MDIKPEVHFGGTVNKTIPTLPGGGKPGLVNGDTNNYYITRTNSNPEGSNSRKGVEVRPAHHILEPSILDPENTRTDNLQIVPNSNFRYESVRDNETDQILDLNIIIPTIEQVLLPYQP